ncbi:MAG: PorP/SprF family type IX secretion system membrane protein [Marinilabiliaceae bacterium]|nr:PorP/SprF family type IX secretion system membrane protein [Marinilabiliaceae bacterium]
MRDLEYYLDPVPHKWNTISGIPHAESLCGNTSFFEGDPKLFTDLENSTILIGVPEAGNSQDNKNSSKSPNIIRNQLYGLRGFIGLKMFDVGNIKGQTVKDRYEALKEVTERFLKKNNTLIIVGGTQDLTVPAYEALSNIRKSIIISVIDAMIDIDVTGKDFSSRAWVNKILDHNNKESLEDLIFLGTHSYLLSESIVKAIKSNYYDIQLLSEIRGIDLNKTEVSIRDSDIFSFDFRSIIGKDAFAPNIASPHGIEPYEACKLCRYAGLSDNLSIIGIFEVTAETGKNKYNNPALAAHMIWHFIDGMRGRSADFPDPEHKRYKNYIVYLDAAEKEIRFYNNEANGRWWMEVPSENNNKKIFSCTQDEYLKAKNNEFPDKWWRLFMKNSAVVLLILVLFCLKSVSLHAQFDSQHSQYMFFPTLYNPGHAGMSGQISTFVVERHQYIGFEGYPKLTAVSIDMPIHISGNPGGAGLMFVNDRIGFYSNLFIQGLVSQRYDLWDGKISVGANLGIINVALDGTRLTTAPTGGGDYHFETDPLVPNTEVSGIGVDLGLGAFYRTEKYFAGISFLHLFRPSPNFKDEFNIYIPRTTYITAGYNYSLWEFPIVLKPSFMVKKSEAIWQFEINMLLLYKGRFWGGVTYRYQDAVALLLGIELNNGIKVGYSFDIPTSVVALRASGTHEVYIGYLFDIDFGKKNKRYKSVRYP